MKHTLLALAAGLFLGLASRLAMRFVALESGVSPGFSAGGSVEVVLFGTLIGAPVALGFFLARRRWALPAGAGVLAGLVVFAFLAVFPTGAAESALRDTPDTPLATAAAFAVVFALYGLLLDWLARR